MLPTSWPVPVRNLIDRGSKLVKDSVARHSVSPVGCTALRESVSSLSSVFGPSLTTPVEQLLWPLLTSVQSPHRITPVGAIGGHRVCSGRMMKPVRRACCNQWPRTGIDRSHVEQISPDKSMNCQCTTAAFTVSHEPEGFVFLGTLASETRPCMRFLSVGSHLCTRASSAQPLARLHLPSASGYHRWAYSAPDPMPVLPQGTFTP